MKLFSWRRAIFPLAAGFAVIGYRAYEQYQKKGQLDSVDFWVFGLTLSMMLGIFAFVGWWANRPD